MRIQNYETLTNHGNRKGREHVAQILEAGLQAADPYVNAKKLIRLEGNMLFVGNPDFEPNEDPRSGMLEINLNDVDRIFVVGAAKGIQRIGLAFEEVLGDRLTGGHIIGKHGDDMLCKKIGVTLAGHPTPDKYCVEGCKKIFALSHDITERDLVFIIAGNGVSSLLTWPAEGIAVEELTELTRLMQIEKGVPTEELNPIRNHVDCMKGGRITRYFQKAKLVNIVAIDIGIQTPPGRLWTYRDVLEQNIWLHNLSEGSTFADAVRILRFWDAWDAMPASVQKHLTKADPNDETVKIDEYESFNARLFGIMPISKTFLRAAKEKATELGYNAVELAQWMRAEAREVGNVNSLIGLNIDLRGEPLAPPVALFTAGEIIVTVGNETGVGGRNQEYVLSASLNLDGSKRVVMGAVDTDGTDGPGGLELEGAPSCLAGGIVDGYTVAEAKERGVDIRDALKTHATSQALWRLDSGIHAEQNISVADLAVILVTE